MNGDIQKVLSKASQPDLGPLQDLQKIQININKLGGLKEEKRSRKPKNALIARKKHKLSMKIDRDSRVDIQVPVIDLGYSFESSSPARINKVPKFDHKYYVRKKRKDNSKVNLITPRFSMQVGDFSCILVNKIVIDNLESKKSIENVKSLIQKRVSRSYSTGKISPHKRLSKASMKQSEYFKKMMNKYRLNTSEEARRPNSRIGNKNRPNLKISKKVANNPENSLTLVSHKHKVLHRKSNFKNPISPDTLSLTPSNGFLKISSQKNLSRDFTYGRPSKTFYQTNPKHFRGVQYRFKRFSTGELRNKIEQGYNEKSTSKNPPMRIQTYSSNKRVRPPGNPKILNNSCKTPKSLNKSIDTEELKNMFITNPLPLKARPKPQKPSKVPNSASKTSFSLSKYSQPRIAPHTVYYKHQSTHPPNLLNPRSKSPNFSDFNPSESLSPKFYKKNSSEHPISLTWCALKINNY
ncbi:unnamed protein product [Moneuplotes crassus]|uniref:Uncharacterized protein n=1 Tax=Euplotes crassus TaxID=5936 RepID=A0AAD1U698_EUPCR|nr:unnamed protein product [Moneuplotes crassus]